MRIPPGHIDWLLGCWVVVLLSYCKRPTTPIHPTNHKHQKTKKKQERKEDKRTPQKSLERTKLTKYWSRRGPEWTQNAPKIQKRRSGAQNHPRWLPGPKSYDGGVDFGPFWGPRRNPKNHQKSSFCKKGCLKERFFIDFCG